MLKLALVLGAAIAGFILLNNLGDSLSGCYQTLTCSDSLSTPVKVGCSQANCSCSGVNTTKCATPQCGGTGCPAYSWNKVSALQALAMLPGMLTSGILAPVTKSSTDLIKTLAIYGSIFIVVAIVAYFLYKYAKNKFSSHK